MAGLLARVRSRLLAGRRSKLGAKPRATPKARPKAPRTSRMGQIKTARRKFVGTDAEALLEAAPAPPLASTVTYLHETSPRNESPPLVEESRWRELPTWIALHAERGRVPLCFYGHALEPAVAPRFSSCYKCGLRPIPQGQAMLWCRACDFWGVCASCAALPRLPSLRDDPLFHGRDAPCLIGWAEQLAQARGTVIICPGGNYEFLCPTEAQPVASLLAEHGIYAVVLRYRLLPAYSLDDALDDLGAAVERVRSARGGPVVACGFSAGGHLIASLAVRHAAKSDGRGTNLLDGQVLAYAAIDGTEWLDPKTCGFFDWERCLAAAPSLLTRQPSLFGGPGFAAPPSFLVYSVYDTTCPPEKHGDRYAEALRAAGVPNTYLRDDYGEHGFGIEGGWLEECVPWLRALGLGTDGG
mmetsp:Transcript_119552/g.338362  ORF Transcript_119552/g.338362 Transcript_119552/m.338362 type:complete len:412 (+) Transcript_119552:211-1446(+)